MTFRLYKFIYIVFHSIFILVHAAFLQGGVSDRDAEVYCKLQPDSYDCKETGGSTFSYYYDLKLEDCKSFRFGTCEHSSNKFANLQECRDVCLDVGTSELSGNFSAYIYCRMQPDFGLCNDYFPMFYFDLSTRSCRGFSYSGCGGNLNRFVSSQVCSAICSQFMDEVSIEGPVIP